MTTETQIPAQTPGGSFAAPDPAGLSKHLDGYEVTELIACGGMGAVYRAQHLSLQREVAIKVLPVELSRFEDFKQAFQSEARAMAKMTHPNLLGVYDFGEVAGMLYLVMEFIDGGSLFQAENGEAVEVLHAVRIVAGVAAGLGHAHRHDILHRDIKPANILISRELEPKLGDFGLAIPTADVASGMAMGTPGYVAPEVVRDFRAATPASDVYSLGVILHELLTGVTPSDEAPPSLEIVPRLRGLCLLVQKATAREPYMRYGDGDEMAKALNKWLANAEKLPPHLIAAAQSGGVSRPVAPVHRTPVKSATRTGGRTTTVVGLAAVLLVAALVFAFKSPKAQPPPLPPADSPPLVVEAPPVDLEVLRKEMRDELAAACDKHVADHRANFAQLRAKAPAGESWTAYFELADQEQGELPRFLEDHHAIPIDKNMAALLNQFAGKAQRTLDEEHLAAVKRIHRSSVSIMKEKVPGQMQAAVATSHDAWLEWLGVDPLEILAINLAGCWESWPGQPQDPDTTITIDHDREVTIAEAGNISGGSLSMATGGGLTILRDDDQRAWRLSWSDPHLDSIDESGQRLARFQRQTYTFRADTPDLESDKKLADADPDPDADPPLTAPEPPEPPEPWNQFKDKWLVKLNRCYHECLERELGALRREYLAKLKDAADRAGKQDDSADARDILAEIEQIRNLDLQQCLLDPDRIVLAGILPDELRPDRTEFREQLVEQLGTKRLAERQQTYIDTMRDRLAIMRTKGEDTTKIAREFALYVAPDGCLRGRYVKLQAEETVGTTQAAISELRFLDARGAEIDPAELSIHSASSFQDAVPGGPSQVAKAPQSVFDGDPATYWMTKWFPKTEAASFPHWIAIDLGRTRNISGFRLLPRANWRRNDILSWSLFTSDDPRECGEPSAQGRFEESAEWKQHRFSDR